MVLLLVTLGSVGSTVGLFDLDFFGVLVRVPVGAETRSDSRFVFDAAMSTPGSNDPIATLWSVSEWLHHVGAYPVSRFVLLCWIDLYRFNFRSSASMAVLPLRPGLEGEFLYPSDSLFRSPWRSGHINMSKVGVSAVSRWTDISRSRFNSTASTPRSIDLPAMLRSLYEWLRESGTSAVSCFSFSSCFVIETLNLELSRLNLDVAMSTDESNDSIRTFGVIYGWLCGAHAFKVSHFDFLHLADVFSFDFDSSTSPSMPDVSEWMVYVVGGWP